MKSQPGRDYLNLITAIVLGTLLIVAAITYREKNVKYVNNLWDGFHQKTSASLLRQTGRSTTFHCTLPCHLIEGSAK